ncbi:unnamed protein product [Rotaria sp. Silwood2]|nr:unnamed protein product [Rotaria sp. Silwood2]
MLDLRNNKIGDQGALYVTEALRDNTKIVALDLQSDKIGDKGVKYIADALQNNTTLEELDLRLNNIGEKGAQDLFNALQNNRTLKKLHLTGNKNDQCILVEKAIRIKHKKVLTSFDLRKNQIGNEGVNCFVNALKNNTNLKHLYLDENEITDSKAVSAILRFRNYNYDCLRLDFYGMGDNLIELLSSDLQRNTTIQHITLITNKIGDRGAQILASLIRNSMRLISLDLRSNHIGDQGASYLADALINNTTMTTLKLRGNEIGPSGTKYLIDAQQNRTVSLC